MTINGFQKMTLLDYPGKVACTLFTGGCNFRCPFCHNAVLVTGECAESYSEEEILSYLEKRMGILDGVCITGGEPLLQKDIADFIRKIKAMGYSVKLDTNGSFPERLKSIVGEGLIDYVAMDIKNSIEKYAVTAGCDEKIIPLIEESIDFLLSGKVDYEFRTTIVRELHNPDDIIALGKRIVGAEKYFLQFFEDSGGLLRDGLSAVDKNTMEAMRNSVKPFVKHIEVRGG